MFLKSLEEVACSPRIRLLLYNCDLRSEHGCLQLKTCLRSRASHGQVGLERSRRRGKAALHVPSHASLLRPVVREARIQALETTKSRNSSCDTQDQPFGSAGAEMPRLACTTSPQLLYDQQAPQTCILVRHLCNR